MSVTIGNRTYRTTDDVITIDGKTVKEIYANGTKVYPDELVGVGIEIEVNVEGGNLAKYTIRMPVKYLSVNTNETVQLSMGSGSYINKSANDTAKPFTWKESFVVTENSAPVRATKTNVIDAEEMGLKDSRSVIVASTKPFTCEFRRKNLMPYSYSDWESGTWKATVNTFRARAVGDSEWHDIYYCDFFIHPGSHVYSSQASILRYSIMSTTSVPDSAFQGYAWYRRPDGSRVGANMICSTAWFALYGVYK